jgi:hypothetical protein
VICPSFLLKTSKSLKKVFFLSLYFSGLVWRTPNVAITLQQNLGDALIS